MALALAVVVLAVGAGLAALLFFVAFEEERVSGSGLRLHQALGVAEQGALDMLRTWDPRTHNVRDPYPFDSGTVPWAPSPHGTGAYGGQVYKLNGELYFIATAATAGQGAQQGAGLLVHVRPIVPGVRAALTVGKGTRWSGSISVDGHDALPPGWDPCGPTDTARAALRGPADAPGPLELGGLGYAALAALATRSVAGGSVLGPLGPAVVADWCDETVATNWGGAEPNLACGGYLPVVHVAGDAALTSGEGQGTLLVDGHLTVRGRLRWRGAILVGGTLRVASDLAVWGAVVVADSAIFDPGVAGSVAITYSKCAIIKALETVTPTVLLSSRGWIWLPDAP